MDYYITDKDGQQVVTPQTDRARKMSFGPRKGGTGTKINRDARECFNPHKPAQKPKAVHVSSARKVDMGCSTIPGSGTRLVKGPVTSRTQGSHLILAQTPFVNFQPGGKGKSVATEQFCGTYRYDKLVLSGNHTNDSLPANDAGLYASDRSIHPVYASASEFFKQFPHLEKANKKAIAYRGSSMHLVDVQNGGKGSLSGPFGGTGHQRALQSLDDNGANSPYAQAKDSSGWTALHACAVNGYEDLLMALIEKGEMDANVKCMKGSSPLSISKKRGWDRIVTYLQK